MQGKIKCVSIIYTNTSCFYTKPCFIYTKGFVVGKNLTYLCGMEQQMANLFWKFIEPRFWWLRHILFLCYYFFNNIVYSLGIINVDFGGKNMWTAYIIPEFTLIYANLLIVGPLLTRRKFVGVLLTCIATVTIYAVTSFWFNPTTVAPADITPIWVEFIQGSDDAFSISTKVVFLRFAVQYLYEFKREQEEKTEQLTSELAYLKNQINPHFLFNTLNNIAVLADLFPERVTPAIIELSNVLRYQLYESEKNTVLLSKEVENLRQNLNLEVMRLNEAKVNISVGCDITGIEVAPLLFLPFLENALKHSANPSGIATIELYFTIVNKNTLLFTAKNSKPPVKPKQIAGGLGLKNIQRRLELIYPQKHELSIDDTKDWYFVSLKINL